MNRIRGTESFLGWYGIAENRTSSACHIVVFKLR